MGTSVGGGSKSSHPTVQRPWPAQFEHDGRSFQFSLPALRQPASFAELGAKPRLYDWEVVDLPTLLKWNRVPSSCLATPETPHDERSARVVARGCAAACQTDGTTGYWRDWLPWPACAASASTAAPTSSNVAAL